LATHRATGEPVAIQIIKKQNIPDLSRIRKEQKILKILDHPNITQLFQLVDCPSEMFVVKEYASHGDLLTYVGKLNRLSEREA
jgi:serine/threonine protein kinase